MTAALINDLNTFIRDKDTIALHEMRAIIRGVVRIGEDERRALSALLETAIETLNGDL